MRTLIVLLSVSLLLFSPKKDRDIRLGTIDESASLKTSGSAQWIPISSEDEGLPLHLNDSLCVEGESLFVTEKVNRKTRVYHADRGRWTVSDIIEGRAYHTNRKMEMTGESVKGNLDGIFFDLYVGGRPAREFHFGDRPQVQVINDGEKPVYYALIWLEEEAVWNMLDSKAGLPLPPKSSAFEESRASFVLAAPEADVRVVLIVSEVPFSVQDAVARLNSPDKPFRTLIKQARLSR